MSNGRPDARSILKFRRRGRRRREQEGRRKKGEERRWWQGRVALLAARVPVPSAKLVDKKKKEIARTDTRGNVARSASRVCRFDSYAGEYPAFPNHAPEISLSPGIEAPGTIAAAGSRIRHVSIRFGGSDGSFIRNSVRTGSQSPRVGE